MKTPQTEAASAALADAARELDIARTGALYADAAYVWSGGTVSEEIRDKAMAEYRLKVAQHKAAALQYAREVLDQVFVRVLDGGELHRVAMPLIDDLIQVANGCPESLP